MEPLTVEYVVGLFNRENGAEQAWERLKAEGQEQALHIQGAAVLRKGAEGRLHVLEPGDPGAGKGAAVGGAVGALLGVLLGPGMVVTTAAGALIGGLVGKLYDTGFDNQNLAALADELNPGTSALLVMVVDEKLAGVVNALEAQGARLVVDALDPKIVDDLQTEYDRFLAKLEETGVDGRKELDGALMSDLVDERKRQDDIAARIQGGRYNRIL